MTVTVDNLYKLLQFFCIIFTANEYCMQHSKTAHIILTCVKITEKLHLAVVHKESQS